MAFNTNKNAILFERMKNVAVAMQNLREECARLQTIRSQEAQGNAAFADTEIATTAELDSMISYCNDFKVFNEGGGASAFSQIARWGWLQPFVDTTPA